MPDRLEEADYLTLQHLGPNTATVLFDSILPSYFPMSYPSHLFNIRSQISMRKGPGVKRETAQDLPCSCKCTYGR